MIGDRPAREEAGGSELSETDVVDAHLHLWQLGPGRYGWLTPELGVLHATITPEHAHEQLSSAGIRRAVLVQADDDHADTDDMLAVAAAHPWVAGVVGWVPLEDPGAAARRLDEIGPGLVGVRQLIHDDPRSGLLSHRAVRETVSEVARRGLALDIPDAWPRDMPDVAVLAHDHPDLRIVLDHLGKPPSRAQEFDRWRDGLADVSAAPSAVAKISGLDHLPADLRTRAWESALELFGPSRLMWGSDWPMTLTAAGYRGSIRDAEALARRLDADAVAQVFAGTAQRTYRLERSRIDRHHGSQSRTPEEDR